ncbi:hypothetical protein ACFHWS_09160 [Micromonospora sp. LOL_013]|uniref:hypothetical protein n=1 Tax=Micromonospora sp. LOL_013 TaxID=3345414 RepID=UPI003A878EBB
MITRATDEMTGRMVPSGSSRLTACLVTTATMLALLVGCTADQDRTPGTGPTPGSGTSAGAGSGDPQLQSLLLTTADLPDGLNPTTDLDDASGGLDTGCQGMGGSTEPAAEARADFAGEPGTFVSESLQQMLTVDDARAAMAELAEVPAVCGTFPAEYGGLSTEVSVTTADPPPVGDEQVGLKFTVSLNQQPLVVLHHYAIRVADLLIVVFHTGPMPGDAKLAGTATEAAYRKATGT